MEFIPRRSIFTLSDENRAKYREKIKEEEAKNEMRNGKKNPEIRRDKTYDDRIVKYYYEIGMLDYDKLYKKAKTNPESISDKDIIEYLKKRANLSAHLQVLEEYLEENGVDLKTWLTFREGSVKDAQPITMYHGTPVKEMSVDEIGKPDEKTGLYYLTDGVVYWSRTPEYAENFTRYPKMEKTGKVIPKEFKPDDNCREINSTDGGACFIWQDEFLRMSKGGIRYLTSRDKRENDILDISRFADFVEQRDSIILDVLNRHNLRFPEQGETLSHYQEFLKSREQEQTQATQQEQEQEQQVGSSSKPFSKRDFERVSSPKDKNIFLGAMSWIKYRVERMRQMIHDNFQNKKDDEER